MRKFFSAIFILFYFVLNAQQFETTINISPNISFKCNETTDSKVAYGMSVSMKEYYRISKALYVGGEVTVSNRHYALIRKITEYRKAPYIYYDSKITANSLDIPLLVKFATVFDCYVELGGGVSYLFHTKSLVRYNIIDDEIQRTLISKKNEINGNTINGLISFGISKPMSIYQYNVTAGVYFNAFTHQYNFQHSSVLEDGHQYNYYIRPKYAHVSLGLVL